MMKLMPSQESILPGCKILALDNRLYRDDKSTPC